VRTLLELLLRPGGGRRGARGQDAHEHGAGGESHRCWREYGVFTLLV
jgi:hypothetical protein